MFQESSRIPKPLEESLTILLKIWRNLGRIFKRIFKRIFLSTRHGMTWRRNNIGLLLMWILLMWILLMDVTGGRKKIRKCAAMRRASREIDTVTSSESELDYRVDDWMAGRKSDWRRMRSANQQRLHRAPPQHPSVSSSPPPHFDSSSQLTNSIIPFDLAALLFHSANRIAGCWLITWLQLSIAS